MPKARKPKTGRPALPPGERGSTVNTAISPATRSYLERVGDGSASRGARLVLAAAAARNLEIPGTEKPPVSKAN